MKQELRRVPSEVRRMSFGVPVIINVGLCVLAGLIVAMLESWAQAGQNGGDPLDLVLGLGFLGLFPGLFWAFLERRLQAVAPARRRLLVYCLLGQLLLGAGCGLLLAGLSLAFSRGMTGLGFQTGEWSPGRIAALGSMYAVLPGLALGYLAALIRSFFWRDRAPVSAP